MMKTSIIKKLMMGALAASLAMAPAMGVFASTTAPLPGSDPAGPDSSVTAIVAAAVAQSTDGAVTSVAEIPHISSVAGVQSTVSGVYLATSVSGTAVSTPVASIAQGYGLAAGERPYAKFSNMDPKKSYLAKQVIDMAAASRGAVVGPMLNIEFGKMSGGKYSLLPTDGPGIRVAIGLPGNFVQNGRTYAVVRVRTGGEVAILEDLDTNPSTVTFETTAGAGAYAIIRY